MQTANTTGRRSRTTDEATLQENPDDGQCVVCTARADGVDAAREGNPPVCSNCAKIRTDGGVISYETELDETHDCGTNLIRVDAADPENTHGVDVVVCPACLEIVRKEGSA